MDPDFDSGKALGLKAEIYGWKRAQDLQYRDKNNIATADSTAMQVFGESPESCTFRQGELGDCYLLSALSVIIHTRPDLLHRIFHPQCRKYRKDGIYVVMLYPGGKPNIVTIDDFFAEKKEMMIHPFVNIVRDKEDKRSIWPMILEKAYAKMFGNYENIDGGNVHTALADLTNGIP